MSDSDQGTSGCHVSRRRGAVKAKDHEVLTALIQPATAEMLKGAAGKVVGIGSALPSAKALARRYIWLDVAPAASIALAMVSQLRISVVIAVN